MASNEGDGTGITVEERTTQQRERLRSTTKTRKSANTRRRIMETASELMLERGNSAFQMSEISRRCNMSKGALYYYFADKEDLLGAIYEEEINKLVDSIDSAVVRSETAGEALHGACTAYADCVREGGPLAMAIVRELMLAREGQDADHTGKAIHHIVGVVATQLEKVKQDGLVRPDLDVKLAATAICGAFAFAAISVRDICGEEDGVAFADELFQIIVHGVGV